MPLFFQYLLLGLIVSCLHNVIVNLQTQAYLRILVNGVDWFYNSSPIGLMDARNYDSL